MGIVLRCLTRSGIMMAVYAIAYVMPAILFLGMMIPFLGYAFILPQFVYPPFMPDGLMVKILVGYFLVCLAFGVATQRLRLPLVLLLSVCTIIFTTILLQFVFLPLIGFQFRFDGL